MVSVDVKHRVYTEDASWPEKVENAHMLHLVVCPTVIQKKYPHHPTPCLTNSYTKLPHPPPPHFKLESRWCSHAGSLCTEQREKKAGSWRTGYFCRTAQPCSCCWAQNGDIQGHAFTALKRSLLTKGTRNWGKTRCPFLTPNPTDRTPCFFTPALPLTQHCQLV